MRTLAILTLTAAASSAFAASEAAEKAYKADIAPIFEASCIGCHGKDGKKPKGGFNMTSLAKMEEGYGKEKKPAIVWGNAAKSPLYTSAELGISKPDDDHAMPPGDKEGRKPLTKEQLEKLKKFIDSNK
ncbi:MAG: hypothetical protein RJA37_869 [Verrucomicrobiota bacterium]|jgi:mono/diheme cytochrome c family protein